MEQGGPGTVSSRRSGERAASAAYRASRARLGLILLDPAWRVTHVSPDVSALLDLPADGLVGRAILQMHPPDLRSRIETLLKTPGETPAARSMTVTLPKRTLLLRIEHMGGGLVVLSLQDLKDLEEADTAPMRPEATALPRIPLDAPEGVDLIEPDRVLFVRSAGHYSHVRLSDGERFCSLPLKDIEARLEGHGFLRVHREYVVNLGRVRTLRRQDGATVLEMADTPGPVCVPVSRGRSARVRSLLAL